MGGGRCRESYFLDQDIIRTCARVFAKRSRARSSRAVCCRTPPRAAHVVHINTPRPASPTALYQVGILGLAYPSLAQPFCVNATPTPKSGSKCSSGNHAQSDATTLLDALLQRPDGDEDDGVDEEEERRRRRLGRDADADADGGGGGGGGGAPLQADEFALQFCGTPAAPGGIFSLGGLDPAHVAGGRADALTYAAVHSSDGDTGAPSYYTVRSLAPRMRARVATRRRGDAPDSRCSGPRHARTRL